VIVVVGHSLMIKHILNDVLLVGIHHLEVFVLVRMHVC
jgi:hypothetical protein